MKRVVVAGAGAAGVASALAAARAGAETVLVESAGFPGGNSAILPWLGFHSRQYQQVVGGIAIELIETMQTSGAASSIVLDPVCGSAVSLNGHVYRCLLMRMLRDAGVEVALHSMVVDVARRKERIERLVVEQKSGRREIEGDVFIDATGDGDVAVKAGVAWEKGRRSDGQVQSPSLVFRVAGIDRDAFVAGLQASGVGFRELLRGHPEVLQRLLDRLPTQEVIVLGGLADLLEQARSAGELDVPTTRVIGVKSHRADELIAVSTKVASFDPTDSDALSGAYIEGYRQVEELMRFFVRWVPGCGAAYLEEVAPMIGIRESRRIMGDYVLSGDDVRSGCLFPDGVAMGAYHIDIHRPDGSGFDSESVRPYDIPLRALIAGGVENLMVAGKCISASHEAIASTRVIPICMAEGHAAGTAAALALPRGGAIRDVPTPVVRRKLRQGGAILREDLKEPDEELMERIGVL